MVISSCGDAGIVNTVKSAQAASGVAKVHAVLGGFHLAPAPDPYVAQTVDALKEINPDYIIPMHCSGRTFTRLADTALPGKVIPSSTGTRFTGATPASPSASCGPSSTRAPTCPPPGSAASRRISPSE